MKKKMVAVLLTAAMVTAIAAGCGKDHPIPEVTREEAYTIGI